MRLARKQHHHRFRKRLLQSLDLPVDADGSALRITMVGNTDLLVENHAGVIRYNDDLIRLQSGQGVIRIEGRALRLSEFGAERAYVRGEIFGWCFENAAGCGIP